LKSRNSAIDGHSGVNRPVLVSVEAIIGAGKSTLLDAIAAHFGDAVVVVPEPVGVWTDVDGLNLLSEYYADQSRWAFSFQTFAIFSRLRAVRQALKQAVKPGVTRAVVMERSWTSDRACFASLLHDSGAMNPIEEAMHRRIYEWEADEGSWPIIDGA
jgi:deoxyadenosine/deoxycytidine kinase